MTSAAIVLACVGAWAVMLLWERARLTRRRRAIPLRIVVTGTRGKTSVARMLAAVLRESGRATLAKTTGSRAAFILPDGTERTIRRRGLPSIMEQKRFIAAAARMKVDAVVSEIMSIHAENHYVEAQQILDPHVVLVTNFRVDHSAAMGDTPEEIASVIALDVPSKTRVFIPRDECLPNFREAVQSTGAELIEVPPGTSPAQEADEWAFTPNFDLVYVAARSLGIDDETTARGIERVRHDEGALGVWRYRAAASGRSSLAVNAFAANDPTSTALVYDKVLEMLRRPAGECVGLLSLRADRGDRTWQWIEALEDGMLARFSRLYVNGRHARALVRRFKHSAGNPIEVLRTCKPDEVMRIVGSTDDVEPNIVFGFGNIRGLGEAMVSHWAQAGDPLTARPPDRPTAFST